MSCKHESYLGMMRQDGEHVYWCCDCGALYVGDDWMAPSALPYVEELRRLKAEIRKLRRGPVRYR